MSLHGAESARSGHNSNETTRRGQRHIVLRREDLGSEA